ncbi:MAG TPA: hypothetical protein PKJ19_03830 [Flavobacteriales bacterium]|nr:hypothetical protein [Flavobacteriales bacterium]HNU57521.1 hypothetical protein [Flavobacteriales bacterium]
MKASIILLFCAAIALLAVVLSAGISYPAQIIFFVLAGIFCVVMARGVMEGPSGPDGH